MFYQCPVDPNVPIEDVAGILKAERAQQKASIAEV